MKRILRQFLYPPLENLLTFRIPVLRNIFCFLNTGRRKVGSVLIITLWAVVTLSILGLALGNFVFSQIKFTNAFIRLTLSEPLAKAACYDAFYERKDDSSKDYDTEKELLNKRSQVFQNNIAYEYYFEDEGSRININIATKDMFQRLPGIDEASADTLVKRRIVRLFSVKEEILLGAGKINGIEDKEKYNQFKDFITVYGNGKININTASQEVLFALGLENDLIDIIMRYRKESAGVDEKKGTDDDGVFINISDILQGLRSFEMLSLRQEQQLLSIMNLLTVKSGYLRLNISTKVMGKAGNNYSIVIDPADNKIVSWTE